MVPLYVTLAACFAQLLMAREIVFPALMPQVSFSNPSVADFSSWTNIPAAVAGLTTFANLPHVFCLADAPNEEVEPFDIAFLGAPFDTVGLPLRKGRRGSDKKADNHIAGNDW